MWRGLWARSAESERAKVTRDGVRDGGAVGWCCVQARLCARFGWMCDSFGGFTCGCGGCWMRLCFGGCGQSSRLLFQRELLLCRLGSRARARACFARQNATRSNRNTLLTDLFSVPWCIGRPLLSASLAVDAADAADAAVSPTAHSPQQTTPRVCVCAVFSSLQAMRGPRFQPTVDTACGVCVCLLPPPPPSPPP